MPATLSFGPVQFVVGASVPIFRTQRLVIRNVGARGEAPDSTTNLRLQFPYPQLPYPQLNPLNAQTDASELSFTVSPYSPYDSTLGLEASAGRDLLEVEVRLTPRTAGLKAAELVILSNDPAQPLTRVQVTGEAIAAQPCTYSVSPTQLNFGVVDFTHPPQLAVKVQAGSGLCRLSQVSIAPDSDPAFELVGGAIAEKALLPGEVLELIVRVTSHPFQGASARGAHQFSIAGELGTKKIPLFIQPRAGCVLMTPDDFNFGTVQKGCSSAPKTFALYNTCSSPVELLSTAMFRSDQAEFALVSSDAIDPGTILNPGSSPATFSVRYRPANYGQDIRALVLKVLQSGTSVDSIVTFEGIGDTEPGPQTMNFKIDGVPRTKFYLSATPDPAGAFTLLENGIAISPAASNGDTVWHYDPLENAVTFSAPYVVPVGATLTLTFDVACSP